MNKTGSSTPEDRRAIYAVGAVVLTTLVLFVLWLVRPTASPTGSTSIPSDVLIENPPAAQPHGTPLTIDAPKLIEPVSMPTSQPAGSVGSGVPVLSVDDIRPAADRPTEVARSTDGSGEPNISFVQRLD